MDEAEMGKWNTEAGLVGRSGGRSGKWASVLAVNLMTCGTCRRGSWIDESQVQGVC